MLKTPVHGVRYLIELQKGSKQEASCEWIFYVFYCMSFYYVVLLVADRRAGRRKGRNMLGHRPDARKTFKINKEATETTT